MPVRSVGNLLLIFVLAVPLACAGRAWDRARDRDTAAGYAEFLREHPGSDHAREAKERSSLVSYSLFVPTALRVWRGTTIFWGRSGFRSTSYC